jgi:hypothetical protein
MVVIVVIGFMLVPPRVTLAPYAHKGLVIVMVVGMLAFRVTRALPFMGVMIMLPIIIMITIRAAGGRHGS